MQYAASGVKFPGPSGRMETARTQTAEKGLTPAKGISPVFLFEFCFYRKAIEISMNPAFLRPLFLSESRMFAIRKRTADIGSRKVSICKRTAGIGSRKVSICKRIARHL
jgi:hypothetical protein